MRQLIAGTAWRLFADRGFDQVTVAEIAREAQVAEATVFNYFPSKEDLFYSRFEAFSARLADAVRDRDPGEPALAAFRRALMATETGAQGDDLRPHVAANALLGLQRAMIDYVRRRASSGEDLSGLAADVRKLPAEAFALLEHGLGDYAARP